MSRQMSLSRHRCAFMKQDTQIEYIANTCNLNKACSSKPAPRSLLILFSQRSELSSSLALPSLQVGSGRNAAYSADFLMGIMAMKFTNNVSHNKLPGLMEATLSLCVKPRSDQHVPHPETIRRAARKVGEAAWQMCC